MQPDYLSLCSCPGETVSELMVEKKISCVEMANLCGCSTDIFCDFLGGNVAVWPGLPENLESIFNVPAAFWIMRDRNYWNYFSWRNRIKRKVHNFIQYVVTYIEELFP
jgi:hypothetical protein